MAQRIKGITIEIGGDTTKLSTAIKNADKEIKNTKNDLKDVEQLLKLDPTNTELLAQKERLLAENVEEVTKKLELLKEAEKQAQEQFAKGEISQQQYDGLKREISATEEELRKATAQADSFNAKLTLASDGASKFANVCGVVAEKTKTLSAVAGGLVLSLGSMGIQAVATSDELNTLAKQTGLSVEEIQKFQYASDIVDVSTDTMISSLSKLKKNMSSTSTDVQEAFNKLGLSVYDNNGKFKDISLVFNDVLMGLSQIPNETERDIIAMQLFGKSADQLAGIIDDGGQALRQLGAEAEASGLILSGETLDSLNEVQDQIDKIKATVQQTIATTGAKVMDTIAPIIEKVINGISKILEFIGNLSSEQLELILIIGTIVASISPIAGIVSGIASAVSSVIAFLPTITAFVSANPILLIATAVLTLAGIIIANWDKIKAIFEEIKEKVKDVFNTIVEFVKEKINALIGVLNKPIQFINKILEGLNKIQFDIPDWIPLIGGKHFGFNIPLIKEIPLLANGGVVGNGGSAIVGENGAEFLTNVGGNAVVTPITANVDTSAITNAIRQGQGNQNISIQFNGSLAQLGRVLQPVIVNETSRKGASAISYV